MSLENEAQTPPDEDRRHAMKHDPSTISNTSTHQPHHMKFGNIKTAGFELSDDQDGFSDCETEDEAHKQKISKDRHRELLDFHARKIHDQRRYLVRKPRPLQYFRGQTLIRDEGERGSSRLELFFDLLFVGLISVLAKEAVSDPTGPGLVRYLITYFMGFLVWTWMREVFNSFYKDDFSQRVLVLYVMVFLVVFGNNAPQAEQNLEDGPARAVTVGAYLLAELGIFGTFFGYSFHIKAYRAQLRAHSAAWLISAALWIGCIFAKERSAIALAAVALFVEYSSWPLVYTQPFKKLFKLRYSSALNIDHEVERFNDFITLVMGEFLYSVFAGQPAGIGVHEKAGKAILVVTIAFSFQMFYMFSGSSRAITHPIRLSGVRGLFWITGHMPIVAALTLTGDASADLIQEEEVENGVRWFFCVGYAVGMIGMTALAALEREEDKKGELWIRKELRLAPRFLSGSIAIFLPLTSQEHIPSLSLLGILASFSLFSFLWEMLSSLDGPNAEQLCAPEHLLKAADKYTPAHALRTPAWKGFPTLFEPGTGHVDMSHQRKHAKGKGRAEAEETA